MSKKIALIILVLAFIACNNGESERDATGVFEATEIIVSSEGNGRLLSFNVSEGQELKKDEQVGLIDTTQLALQKNLLAANKVAILSNKPNVKAQIEATEQELVKQKKEKVRIEKLLAGDVATQKQLDDIDASIEILRARLAAQKSSLNISNNALDQQGNTVDIQIAQLQDQLKKCRIISPIDGTVLVKYAEENELTGIGKALFKIADVSQMNMQAYFTSDQLSRLKLGQNVSVLADFGEEEVRKYDGTISWISTKAEFTPKTIQTQDERANLVYAVKISVKNDGYLKIGMYGGVKITSE